MAIISDLPRVGSRCQKAQAPDAVEPLSEAQALSGEVERRMQLIPPGPDPIKQGEKAFQAMGPFARVVPTIVFHGTADHISDPINGDQVTQQWITTNQLASGGDFTATFEHPISHQSPCRAAWRKVLHRVHVARRPRPRRGHLLRDQGNGPCLVRRYPREHLHGSKRPRRK